jgi:hypothetical protein
MFQNKVDALGMKPISKADQFAKPNEFALMKPRTLTPPLSPIEPDKIVDVGVIEADAMDGTGMKKMKKGSPAMKAHMAKLRAMRKK